MRNSTLIMLLGALMACGVMDPVADPMPPAAAVCLGPDQDSPSDYHSAWISFDTFGDALRSVSLWRTPNVPPCLPLQQHVIAGNCVENWGTLVEVYDLPSGTTTTFWFYQGLISGVEVQNASCAKTTQWFGKQLTCTPDPLPAAPKFLTDFCVQLPR